jgi:transposase-like protein
MEGGDMTTRRRHYGIAEIADALGVDRQLVTVWRRRLSRGMPPPDDELAAGPLWVAATIEPWIEETRARLARERSAGGPPPPQLLKRAARRLLRLTVLLLEEEPRSDSVARALQSLGQLGPDLASYAGDGDPARRLLTDIAALAGAAAAHAATIDHRADVEGADLARLCAECVRLLPVVGRLLETGGISEGSSARR